MRSVDRDRVRIPIDIARAGPIAILVECVDRAFVAVNNRVAIPLAVLFENLDPLLCGGHARYEEQGQEACYDVHTFL